MQSGKLVITKTNSEKNGSKPAALFQKVELKKHNRKVYGSIVNSTAKHPYRPELRQVFSSLPLLSASGNDGCVGCRFAGLGDSVQPAGQEADSGAQAPGGQGQEGCRRRRCSLDVGVGFYIYR